MSGAKSRGSRGRRKRGHSFIARVGSPDVCWYCGEGSTCIDHAVPFCVAGSHTFGVYACASCNAEAGSFLAFTLGQKAKFIAGRLRAKNGRLMRVPNWSHDDLDTLRGRLRDHVTAMERAAGKLRRRLGMLDLRSASAHPTTITLVAFRAGWFWEEPTPDEGPVPPPPALEVAS